MNDWPSESKRAGYRVSQVAGQLKVSTRWLEIYFRTRFGKCPHEQFSQWRDEEIARLAAEGRPGKKILDEVGLSHSSSLSRNGHSGLREIQRDVRGGGYGVEMATMGKGEREG